MAEKKIPAPIDRPLSKAYLREFAGWSTAYPPGQSEPNSLRVMENVWIDRNGAVAVRPGLRCLTYTEAPGLDPLVHGSRGTGLGLPVVGGAEPFYTADGDRALLFAVREPGGRVGFRAMLSSSNDKVVHGLEDAEIGFVVPQGADVLNFEEGTTHVEYLQINNRILALSDNGEPARLFYVGGQKLAKKLVPISVPDWDDDHKLEVMHPDAAWIASRTSTLRTNNTLNPSFEIGTLFWTPSQRCRARTVNSEDGTGRWLEVSSLPERINMQPCPLHDVAATGPEGWDARSGVQVAAAGPYLQVTTALLEGFAEGPRIIEAARYADQYRIALDIDADEGALPQVRFTSHAANGAELGHVDIPIDVRSGRWESPAIAASTGAASLRVDLGSGSPNGAPLSVRYRNLMVCPDGQPTEMMHGGMGEHHYWTGAPGRSASVLHPPVDIWVDSQPYPAQGSHVTGSAHFRAAAGETNSAGVLVESYDVTWGNPLATNGGATDPLTDSWQRLSTSVALQDGVVAASLRLKIKAVARGQRFYIDSVMQEDSAALGSYFDGSTLSTSTVLNSWQGLLTTSAHESPSEQRTFGSAALTAETPTTKTLVKTGGAAANEFKMGLFYTFENEIGESAPSKITEIRIQRPWANWYWETANTAGEPSGTYTDSAFLCADQLVCRMPQEVYDKAVSEGALKWNLYAMGWSDQEPVPVVAQLVESQNIYTDIASAKAQPLPYDLAGWIALDPSRRAGEDDALLPSADNRVNSSVPPTHRNGVVAGDRMILVGSPFDPATISWSSSAPGQYTKFTPNRGGGRKTLTSGNLNLPVSVVLWQNPQSVDTLTILCADDNGRSASYYMSPAQVQSGNAGGTVIMGFEETTSTPGTVAPFAAQVLNNALYRPLDRMLVKSTANNYNVNHKTQTDLIANMWRLLQSKARIMAASLENRLYYLVHNPQGELLLPHCRGNEIWVYDVEAKNGHWSRFLVQGSALEPVDIGSRTYMGVSRPDGIFYLDEDARSDEASDLNDVVYSRPIPWRLETNTQGANRAHDAWCHLQQVSATFGDWQGSVRYGIRGLSLNGRQVNASKIFTDDEPPPLIVSAWDVEDHLLVRRDLREWTFYAESLTGTPGTGKIGYVQYRYTPVSVNVGYEFGSVETFEYGRNVAEGGDSYSRNGVPLPYVDYQRP